MSIARSVKMERKNKSEQSTLKWFFKHWKASLIVLLTVVVVSVLATVGVYRYIDSQSASIGLKDIGELSTQSAIVREVEIVNEGRNVFGIKIPLTNTKQLFSYEVEIKAGYDFSKIKLTRSQHNKKIYVHLPKPIITGNEIVDGSLKVYYDKQSIFKPITLKETDDSRKKMKKNAEKTAKKSKLFENAEENAQKLIREFLSKDKANKDYEIVFK